MTSVKPSCCGGCAARSSILDLRTGSQLPGYGGHSPGLRYRIGQRYGQDTFELSQPPEYDCCVNISVQPQIGSAANTTRWNRSSAESRYTTDMVPGYTGYIPKKMYQYGGTYGADCDRSILEFSTEYANNTTKHAQLTGLQTPSLKAVRADPLVKERLDMFGSDRPVKHATFEGYKKAWMDAPVPGYGGHILRICIGEVGLGTRFQEASRSALHAFHGERQPGAQPSFRTCASPRIYTQQGMIPAYTGYIPQKRFQFGASYGDTTRASAVCGAPSFSRTKSAVY